MFETHTQHCAFVLYKQ